MISKIKSYAKKLFKKEVKYQKILANTKWYGDVHFGEHSIVDKYDIIGNCRVEIGKWSILTGPGRIVSELNSITIGNFCSLAPGVQIFESLHRTDRVSTFYIFTRVFDHNHCDDIASKGPIAIGNDVWIGANAVILSGVTIGNGAIVAAGSVVTKDVKPFSVVAGVPATLKKMRFSEDQIEILEKIKWWNWDVGKLKENKNFFKLENPSVFQLSKFI